MGTYVPCLLCSTSESMFAFQPKQYAHGYTNLRLALQTRRKKKIVFGNERRPTENAQYTETIFGVKIFGIAPQMVSKLLPFSFFNTIVGIKFNLSSNYTKFDVRVLRSRKNVRTPRLHTYRNFR